MGWQGTRLLTNGEHDELWRNAFKLYIPSIADSLRRTNIITVLKDFHDRGWLSDDAYMTAVLGIIEKEGVDMPTLYELITKSEKEEGS